MFTDVGLTVVSLVPERCRMLIRMCRQMPRQSDTYVGSCWQISVNEFTVVCTIGCVTSVCHVYFLVMQVFDKLIHNSFKFFKMYIKKY